MTGRDYPRANVELSLNHVTLNASEEYCFNHWSCVFGPLDLGSGHARIVQLILQIKWLQSIAIKN